VKVKSLSGFNFVEGMLGCRSVESAADVACIGETKESDGDVILVLSFCCCEIKLEDLWGYRRLVASSGDKNGVYAMADGGV